jgi:hypothetical protein
MEKLKEAIRLLAETAHPDVRAHIEDLIGAAPRKPSAKRSVKPAPKRQKA